MIVGLVMNRKEVAEETETDSNRIGLIVILVVYFVVKVFVIYAEGVYVSEVGKGIMSRATHDREKYSW
jgi:hypothetical protein